MNKLYKQIATLGFGCFLSAVSYSAASDSSDAHSALRLRLSLRARWSPKEKAILQAKVLEFGRDWLKISKSLPGRTPASCQMEFDLIICPKLQQENPELPQKIKRKNTIKFKPEEDALLRQAVTQYGTNDWSLIASSVTGRTARQCRERWNKYLAPDPNLSPWTLDEDALLQQKVQELGTKWTLIKTFLHDRTDMQCRNRWHTLQGHNKKAQLAPLPMPQPAQQRDLASHQLIDSPNQDLQPLALQQRTGVFDDFDLDLQSFAPQQRTGVFDDFDLDTISFDLGNNPLSPEPLFDISHPGKSQPAADQPPNSNPGLMTFPWDL
jgi:hypothetical protein